MAIKVRVDTVTYNKSTRRYDVMATLYDDAGPVDISRKSFVYSTSYTDDAVRNAVIEGFKYSANAYIRRGEVKATLTNALATLVVPTTFEPLQSTSLPIV